MDWLWINSIENLSIIAGGKAVYVGIVVGRWVDMVRVYRSSIDCFSFLAKIESKVISRERMREEVLEVRREGRK